MIENRTFDELAVGDTASLERALTPDDLYVFARASGNLNPIHLPEGFRGGRDGKQPVAPSLWLGSLVSAVLGNQLPGPGTLYHGQTFRFLHRAHIGDALHVSVRVIEKGEDRRVRLDTRVTRADGTVLLEGEADVTAPSEKLSLDEKEVPQLLVQHHRHIERLVAACDGLEPLPTAVVAPDEENALGGALLAARQGLIRPMLIGDDARIRATAERLEESLDGVEVIDVPDDDKAAARAVALANEGRASAIMKGHLHTDVLLHHVVKHDGGLRTRRRLSHVFVMDVPGLDHLLLVTDAAINIAPGLEEKIDIVQNAIHLAQALGMQQPKVGILSAVEIVNPKIPSTLDAAVLSKMAERGQITGGIVDGPLAMDNALSIAAARTKGITSLVAGHAEVLVAPNLESGNMLAKELAYVAHAEGAGVVLGARLPIMLTSRADDDRARLASCAVAALYDAWQATGRSRLGEQAP